MGEPVEIPLKRKYRERKPWGRFRADYMGNSGKSSGKHIQHPAIANFRKRGYRASSR